MAFHGAALGNVSLGMILLVEDEVLIRFDLAECLRAAGIRNVLEAGNAGHARGDPAINFVISDVRMPGATDGVALAGWLRANRPHVKVVLVSGHLPSLQTGAADLLVEKPMQPQSLIASIRPDAPRRVTVGT